ncbi:MAG: hypothetical protein CMN74_12320 [Sphingorhabdus sp.]|nr:hypothetical protein [Sphingorhabdus sp.]|tara:strand:+ start:500 stop:691 length:192 start_codon:yes stop_codon:yes gene_type:complete
MENERAFWDAFGNLTYDEAVSVGEQLSAAHEINACDLDESQSIARLLSDARRHFYDQNVEEDE